METSILASILLYLRSGKFHKNSTNLEILSLRSIKRRADKNPLFGAIKPYVTWVCGLLEVSVKETLKSLAVTSFVACHLVYCVVDCVESVLLCARSKVELTCCCFCVLLAEIFSFSCLLCLYIILQTRKGGYIVFPKRRLATRAICERIPFELQVFM